MTIAGINVAIVLRFLFTVVMISISNADHYCSLSCEDQVWGLS